MDDAFYAGRRSRDVPFVVNDSVELVSGAHDGDGGAVISIEAMTPELLLLVELSDGKDCIVPARSLKLL